MKFNLFLFFVLVSLHKSIEDKVEDFLSLFDLDFDDVVVEDGENWVERYYIK